MNNARISAAFTDDGLDFRDEERGGTVILALSITDTWQLLHLLKAAAEIHGFVADRDKINLTLDLERIDI